MVHGRFRRPFQFKEGSRLRYTANRNLLFYCWLVTLKNVTSTRHLYQLLRFHRVNIIP